VPEALDPGLLNSAFQFRILPKKLIGPSSYMVFANYYILVTNDSIGHWFYAFEHPPFASCHREYFSCLWDEAQPIVVAPSMGRQSKT